MKNLLLPFLILFSNLLFAQDCQPDENKRLQVITLTAPYNFVAQVEVKRMFKTYRATVSFISKNVIIGAGHSFREKTSKIKSITLLLGKHKNANGKFETLKTVHFKRRDLKIWVGPRFERGNEPHDDYAYVALPENVSENFFELADAKTLPITDEQIVISGYPSSKNGELWIKEDKIKNITISNTSLTYGIYTEVGDSGAPIWCFVRDKYFVIGIHNTGNINNSPCNAGTRLNSERIESIERFIQENKK